MAAQTEITATEFCAAIEALEKAMGPLARISVYLLLRNECPLHASVYLTANYSAGADFSEGADTFAELLGRLTARWTEHAEAHRKITIRRMALAIIRITAELGECTDAALRNCGEFDPGQVEALGELACADASDIAGRGPFAIITIGGANAEAA